MQANIKIRSIVNNAFPQGDNYLIIDGVDKFIPISTNIAVVIIRQLRLTASDKVKETPLSKIYEYK